MKLTDKQKSLVSQNMRLAQMLAHRYSRNNQQYEDRQQSAFLALCNAAAGFKEDYGTSFTTYAYSAIERQLQRDITKENKQLPTISLDKPLNDDLTLEDTLADDYDFADHIADPALNKALNKLDERTANMIYLYYGEQRTYDEIGQLYGITRARVQQIVKKGLDTLKRHMV